MGQQFANYRIFRVDGLPLWEQRCGSTVRGLGWLKYGAKLLCAHGDGTLSTIDKRGHMVRKHTLVPSPRTLAPLGKGLIVAGDRGALAEFTFHFGDGAPH